jgi:ribonuclease HIII
VAAASILARAAFLEGLHTLSTEWNLTLPKGASKKVLEVGRTFVRTHGREALANVSKGHFKTTNQILGS